MAATCSLACSGTTCQNLTSECYGPGSLSALDFHLQLWSTHFPAVLLGLRNPLTPTETLESREEADTGRGGTSKSCLLRASSACRFFSEAEYFLSLIHI